MTRISFKWEGMDELTAGLDSIATNTKTVLEAALMGPAATVGERRMKEAAPKDTGQLAARTQTTIVSDTDIEWRSDVPYAGYQDFGTARQPGTPYFRSSIVAVKRLIERRAPVRLEASMSRVLTSGGRWNPRRLI